MEGSKMDIKKALKTKTTRLGIAGILGAATGYLTGALSPAEALNTGFMSLAAIFLRDSVTKLEQ